MNYQTTGNIQKFVEWHMFGMGLLFFILAHALDGPIMDAKVYGESIGQYPAEWWALAVMSGSSTLLAGLYMRDSFASVIFRVAGSAIHLTIMVSFVAGGMSSEHGLHLSAWSLTLIVMHCFFLAWNTADFVKVARGAHVWTPR